MEIKEYSKSGLKFVEINNNYLVLTLCDLGASMYSITIDGDDMTMVTEDEKDYLSGTYSGKTIGRTCNRIPGNSITIDGKEYKLQENEGENTLHGGKNGISKHFFNYKILQGKSSTKIVFKYTSKDKESGFPGALKVWVTYTLKENSKKIKVSYKATTTKPTLCNLTNHAFFTLGENDGKQLSFKTYASTYLETKKEDLLPIKKSPIFKELDFRKYRKIGQYINKRIIREGKANGYDHYYYFDEVNDKKPLTFLKGQKYLLKITSNYVGVQLFSDNYPSDIKWRNLPKVPNRSITLEPSDPFLAREVLRPSEKYERSIIYEFTKLKRSN